MIKFTGDRQTDKILNIWADWFVTQHKYVNFEKYDNKDLDKLMYEIGLEDFVEFVYSEFPQMKDIGFDYDPKWAWEEFVSTTKYGYDTEEALGEFLGEYVVDNNFIVEFIDNDLIAETYQEWKLDDFFDTHKKLHISAKDKDLIYEAFREGVCVTLSNGFSFCPSEYVTVLASDGDAEGHEVMDLHKLSDNSKGKYIIDTYVYNSIISEEYNGDDVYTCFEVDVEEIVRQALE